MTKIVAKEINSHIRTSRSEIWEQWWASLAAAAMFCLILPPIIASALNNKPESPAEWVDVYKHVTLDPTTAFTILAVFALIVFALSESFTSDQSTEDVLLRYKNRESILFIIGLFGHVLTLTQIAYIAVNGIHDTNRQTLLAILAIVASAAMTLAAVGRTQIYSLKRLITIEYLKNFEDARDLALSKWPAGWKIKRSSPRDLPIYAIIVLTILIVTLVLNCILMQNLLPLIPGIQTDRASVTVACIAATLLISLTPAINFFSVLLIWQDVEQGVLRYLLILVPLMIFAVSWLIYTSIVMSGASATAFWYLTGLPTVIGFWFCLAAARSKKKRPNPTSPKSMFRYIDSPVILCALVAQQLGFRRVARSHRTITVLRERLQTLSQPIDSKIP